MRRYFFISFLLLGSCQNSNEEAILGDYQLRFCGRKDVNKVSSDKVILYLKSYNKGVFKLPNSTLEFKWNNNNEVDGLYDITFSDMNNVYIGNGIVFPNALSCNINHSDTLFTHKLVFERIGKPITLQNIESYGSMWDF